MCILNELFKILKYSANFARFMINLSLLNNCQYFRRDKRNREHADNLPLPSISSADAQYSLNLQLQSNLQSQERETSVARNNILSNEASSQQQQVENFWEENHSSFNPVVENNDDLYSLRHMR